MYKVGDWVYHRSINGNGRVVVVDDTKQRDKYGVKFDWLKYKSADFHNLDGAISTRSGRWCSEDQLVKTLVPNKMNENKVGLLGNRSLERLIRRITKIPRTKDIRRTCEIAINYGAGTRYLPTRTKLCLNEHVVYNKWHQCRMLLDCGIPVPEIQQFDHFEPRVDTDWVLKPYNSMGGNGIYLYGDAPGHIGGGSHYFQRYIKKAREFRVQVALWAEEPAFLIQEKRIDDTSQLCWNKKQGGRFHYPLEPHLGNMSLQEEDAKLVSDLQYIGIAAVQALKLDFGGVDICLDTDGNLWVFEVNSRCGLRERTFSIFKQVVWSLSKLDIAEYKANRWPDVPFIPDDVSILANRSAVDDNICPHCGQAIPEEEAA